MTTATLLLLLLAMSTASAVPDVGNCDLFDPEALGRCLKRLLEQSRGKVRQESDPLHLPDHNDDALTAREIVIRGLSSYSVPQLSVTFPAEMKIAISAQISWPGITGDLFVRVKKCKRIIFKKRCASASARPHVKVGATIGTLSTTLEISIEPDGHLRVHPAGTAVSLNLASVRVQTNLRGVGKYLDRILGKPSNYIATRLANKWWSKNKGKVETKARNALEKAIREDLSVNLADLLKLEPEPTEPAPVEVLPQLEMRSAFAAAASVETTAAPTVDVVEIVLAVEGETTSPPGMRCLPVEDTAPTEPTNHTEAANATDEPASAREEIDPTEIPDEAQITGTDADAEQIDTKNTTENSRPKMKCIPIADFTTTLAPGATEGIHFTDAPGSTHQAESTAAPDPTGGPQ